MPDLTKGPETPSPAQIIREAIAWVRARGVYVAATRNPGVICASGAVSGLATWERDPYADEISPVGAVILKAQPQTCDDEDAATIALGVPIAFIEGLEDGVTMTEPVEARKHPIERRQYLLGFELGLMTRGWLLRPKSAAVLPGEGISS
jgi:hypothetical protein